MENQEKVMNQLYKIGFKLDGSYYSYEERKNFYFYIISI